MGESHWAAEAAECANLQNKFWEYHDWLYTKWLGENVGMYQKPMLEKFAADLGLDTARFDQCLDSDATLAAVQADITEGEQLGVNGTPSFFVDGQRLSLNSLEFSEFQRLLNPLIK